MYRLIHVLGPLDRPRLKDHFLRLSPDDRRLRFGGALPDDMLLEYVDHIDFSRDQVLAAFDARFEVIAVAHVGFLPGGTAELGLSVQSDHRREGLAMRLVRRAINSATTHRCNRLWIHFLTENRAMASLTRKLGMRTIAVLGESDAYLDLPAASSLEVGVTLCGEQIDAVLGALRQWVPRAA